MLLKSTAFHHGPNTNFKCSIVSTAEEIAAGEGQWEMTLRYREDPAKVTEKKFSWGVPVSNDHVAKHFTVSMERDVYLTVGLHTSDSGSHQSGA